VTLREELLLTSLAFFARAEKFFIEPRKTFFSETAGP
jgi:hypothetical protein